MRLRSSLLIFVGLVACTSAEEDAATIAGGSTGESATSSAESSTSGVGTASGSSTTVNEPSTSSSSTTSSSTSSEESASDSVTSDEPFESSGSGSSGDGPTPATESGDGETASVLCAELEDCCDQIGSDLYGGCITVVQMANPDLCDSILSTYHQEGYCTGETFCAELGECCSELPPGPGWQDTCEYYADFGNQPQCAMLIGDYQLSNYCL